MLHPISSRFFFLPFINILTVSQPLNNLIDPRSMDPMMLLPAFPWMVRVLLKVSIHEER